MASRVVIQLVVIKSVEMAPVAVYKPFYSKGQAERFIEKYADTDELSPESWVVLPLTDRRGLDEFKEK